VREVGDYVLVGVVDVEPHDGIRELTHEHVDYLWYVFQLMQISWSIL
jgi:hypothetical protein